MNLSETASAASPATTYLWRNLPESQRLALSRQILITVSYVDQELINFLSADDNGYVVVSIVQSLQPGERGTLLLDIEEILKNNIDMGITIWLEPQADKSSLRKLRGIEIKK
jgi:hypothetical protein